MPARRQLRFATFDDAIADIERLRDGGYTPTMKWNLTEVCEHLRKTMHAGLHGGTKPLPWILRVSIARLLVEYMVWRHWMPNGAKAPAEFIPEDYAEDDPERIEACIALMREARDFSGKLPPNPLAAGLSVETWQGLQVLHAEHHLSKLEPATAA
ncbi:hypothetical protein Mal64_29610 [Pseudobythopirellula maris]|uniref:DinB superfamily protein n=1 Tax=Pseudobythopirellula maris TaxID=2527991 RepID=A0A5C5ZJ59_9BACT|nr:DUF1569 domain-containing protein [Pseudobythopirellula maris]TWT87422.1 hypothetical protein Mal64_29610 [Pseudobythopirellula maris]